MLFLILDCFWYVICIVNKTSQQLWLCTIYKPGLVSINKERFSPSNSQLIDLDWANKQQDDDGNEADAQFRGSVFRFVAPHAINYLGKKLG